LVRDRRRSNRRPRGYAPYFARTVASTIRAANRSAIISRPGRKSAKDAGRSFPDPLSVGVCLDVGIESDRHTMVICLSDLLTMKGSVPEFGLPSCLHLSIVPVIDLLQATLQPLQFRRPIALHPANGLRHSGFASHDFFALMRRRSRALQIETQLGVLGPGRW
jgi:hypothetical protein